MAFLRRKKSHGREYVYLVENYRDKGGSVRQRVLRYVGPTDPAYGGRGPVDIGEERERRRRRRDDG